MIQRSATKYGNRALKFSYIEFGHIAQNIYLLCEELNIGCYHLGALDNEGITKILDIPDSEEYVIGAMGLGTLR